MFELLDIIAKKHQNFIAPAKCKQCNNDDHSNHDGTTQKCGNRVGILRLGYCSYKKSVFVRLMQNKINTLYK